MADVFVSYARADEARVEHIVRALSDAGFSVWWDRSLEPGTNWPDIIDRELRRARCVVVVFSARSAASRWVSIEAHEARRRGILVPVVVERLELADEFASVQRLEWLSPDDAGAAKRLVAQVRKLTRRHRRRRALATAAVIAAFAAGVWFFVRGPDDEVAPAAAAVAIPEHSVAILPFEQEGLGDAPDLGEAIAIDLLESLARVQGLRVAAQVASWTAASEPVEGIRERLKVAWLVEGNLAPASAGHLRVRVRLVDTATGYVRKTWDVVTGEDELGGLTATLVRHLIRVIPGAAAADVAIAVPGVDGDAYRYYLLARALLSEGRSPVDRVRAESYLEESVALQPDFAPAHAGLCEVRLWRYEVNHDPLDLDRADARCRKAAALAPEDPLVVLATAQLQAARGEHTSAVRRLQALLEHDPADAAARGALARSLAALRRNDDAEQEFLRVVREQPGHWGAHSAYGGFLLSEGRTDEAVRQFVLALDLAPEDPIALSNLGGALLATAELQGAIRAFRRSLAVAETPRPCRISARRTTTRTDWRRRQTPSSGPPASCPTTSGFGATSPMPGPLSVTPQPRPPTGKPKGSPSRLRNGIPIRQPGSDSRHLARPSAEGASRTCRARWRVRRCNGKPITTRRWHSTGSVRRIARRISCGRPSKPVSPPVWPGGTRCWPV
ncbi:MAG TPA: TIR domain-containing protein [Pseudomonadales bacterium]